MPEKVVMNPDEVKLDIHVLMMNYFEEALEIAREEISKYNLPSFLEQDILNVLKYSLEGGKLLRGKFLVQTYCLLVEEEEQQESLNEQELRIICLVGWCIEIVQAFFLVADDVMDQSETRRGKPCWYKIVGLSAINDAVLLESLTFCILKCIVPPEIYFPLTELIRETIFKTELGQALDMNLAEKTQICHFKMKDYLQMVTYKTAHYSFVFPIQAAFIIYRHQRNGVNLCETHKNASQISQHNHALENALLQIGQLFQVQDDYLDCFGEPEITGKIGTDIQDKKYSWLVVRAVELLQGNCEGMAVLEANYGKNDEECIAKIKELYRKLQLENAFHDWEAEMIRQITTFAPDDESPEKQLTTPEMKIVSNLCKLISHRKK